nr:hypothetical protein [Kordiimonas gwangyangensis]
MKILRTLALCGILFSCPLSAQETAQQHPLLTTEAGARVHSFSTEFGSGWEASNLVLSKDAFAADGKPLENKVWSSATNAPFPHWILFAFDEPQSFETFVFDNWLEDEESHPGISARGIELWIGDKPDSLTKAAAFELARNETGQSVRIEPATGQYLKLVITSNWGHPWYTELGYTRALSAEKPADDIASRLKLTAGRTCMASISILAARACAPRANRYWKRSWHSTGQNQAANMWWRAIRIRSATLTITAACRSSARKRLSRPLSTWA